MNGTLSDTPESDGSTLFGRRRALQLLGLAGAGASLPVLRAAGSPDHHPAADRARGTPAFFPEADYQLLLRLVDIIIPATETAGAVQAGVPQFIDAALATANGAQLGEMSGSADVFTDNAPVLFSDGLRWIRDQARSRHGRDFLELQPAQQAALLEALFAAAEADGSPPGRANQFLRALKALTVTAYYTSEPGLMTELGYKGNTPRMAFTEECDPRIPQGPKDGP